MPFLSTWSRKEGGTWGRDKGEKRVIGRKGDAKGEKQKRGKAESGEWERVRELAEGYIRSTYSPIFGGDRPLPLNYCVSLSFLSSVSAPLCCFRGISLYLHLSLSLLNLLTFSSSYFYFFPIFCVSPECFASFMLLFIVAPSKCQFLFVPLYFFHTSFLSFNVFLVCVLCFFSSLFVSLLFIVFAPKCQLLFIFC